MPTLPSGPSPEPVGESHRQRGMAESFGIDAERYDRTRPRYPDAMVERVVAATPGPEILDVGSGTGIAARQFQAAGCRVFGVEPDARMAEFARGRGLESEQATIETWDPAGRRYDGFIAAQTWHWVDPVAGAAKAAEVLRPGGRLALFWNVALTPPDVTEAFGELYNRLMPGSLAARAYSNVSVEAYSAPLTKAMDGIRQAGAFTEPEQWKFEWTQPYTRDEWLDVLPTQGVATQLPADRLNEILAEVGAALDRLGGAFTMNYTTIVVTATRM
ncbi:class I SAM-dependent methyltransferase [Actinomadura barringtoniae]|uniref:Class I SAM-dependent methyltransferase n=1 Tax=Actinomadura barringtoniae TaxID=1427535 RepID=A0A939PH23_9ACTN|nr:class I SAM-dependent methyltransferase [Actinomadura barringtoniae]MBO2449624.1 class I SAM-dependent methyltransferase [Actinomadura barringtoniae]